MRRTAARRRYHRRVQLNFSAEVWFWRGPSPFHFVTIPPAESELFKSIAASVTYGWGMVPCMVSVGHTHWETSLWPKEGGYILPLKSAVRQTEDIRVGDLIDVELVVE